MNHVAFPLYDGLAFVFGKGRATGKSVVGLEELNRVCEPTVDTEGMMMHWINIEAPNERSEFGDEENNPNDRTSPPPMAEEQTQPFQTDKTTQSDASSKPKRMCHSARTSGSEVSELKPILKDAVSSLKSMLVGSDAVHNQRNMLIDELKKIDGLSRAQVMDATVALGKDDRMLQIFFNMVDPEDRKCLVERVIR
ncbi:hypothetical protein LINPERHAP2_LOCUS10578 [Linum perenne]